RMDSTTIIPSTPVPSTLALHDSLPIPPPPPPHTGIDVERAGLIKWIKLLGLHKEEQRPGYHEIICPWVEAHSDKGTTGTYYMEPDRKSTRLNSSHVKISYAVFCLQKKK